jgi:hypothetical protein
MIIEVRKGSEDALSFVWGSNVRLFLGNIHKLPDGLVAALYSVRKESLQITISDTKRNLNLVIKSFHPSDIPNAYALAELTSEPKAHFGVRMLKTMKEILLLAGFK